MTIENINIDAHVANGRLYIAIGPSTYYRELADMQRLVDERSIPVDVLFWQTYIKLIADGVDLSKDDAVATAIKAEPVKWTPEGEPVKAADSGNGGLVSNLEQTEDVIVNG